MERRASFAYSIYFEERVAILATEHDLHKLLAKGCIEMGADLVQSGDSPILLVILLVHQFQFA